MEQETLVTVLSYSDHLYDFAIIRSRLESEGIYCVIQHEFGFKTGPAILQVKKSDLPKAVAILKEVGYIKKEQGPIEVNDQLNNWISSIPSKPVGEKIQYALVFVALLLLLVACIYWVLSHDDFTRYTN